MKELILSQEDIKRFNAARGMLSKLATTDPSSEFNETVPSINQDRAAYNESSETGTGANTGTFKKAVPAQNIQGQTGVEEPAAMPMGGEEQMEGPEAMGARAAQSFLGPDIMNAAMSGDTAAMDLIARTAGQVAGAVTEFAMRAPAGNGTMGGGEMGMDPNQMGAEGEQGGMMAPGGQMGGAAPAPITTPEQDLANEIVPPVAANPLQGPAGQENGNGNGSGVPETQNTQNGAPAEKGGFPPAKKEGESGKEESPKDKGGFPPAKKEGEPDKGQTPGGNEDDDKIDLKTVAKLIQAAKAGKI